MRNSGSKGHVRAALWAGRWRLIAHRVSLLIPRRYKRDIWMPYRANGCNLPRGAPLYAGGGGA